jgi:hypothetical protein
LSHPPAGFSGTVPHSGHRPGVARRSYPHVVQRPRLVVASERRRCCSPERRVMRTTRRHRS